MNQLITLDPAQSIANLVLEHSASAPVLRRYRIDFCCRGEMSIAAAAEQKGLNLAALINELATAITQKPGATDDPRALDTPRLIAHIVARHHEYLRETLPLVSGLMAKVCRVHGDHNPKLRQLQIAFERLAELLLPHLDEEEQTLFPALTAAQPDPVTTSKLLASMADEHLDVADLLERIHAASDGFAIPDWACGSYRALFLELRRIESDLLLHVHLENHVLKPRFIA